MFKRFYNGVVEVNRAYDRIPEPWRFFVAMGVICWPLLINNTVFVLWAALLLCLRAPLVIIK